MLSDDEDRWTKLKIWFSSANIDSKCVAENNSLLEFFLSVLENALIPVFYI